jgi:hypothetical protein
MRLSTSTSQTIHTALFALLLVLSASMAGPVNARDSQSTRFEIPFGISGTTIDEFETLAVISADELAELRGGFEISGLQIDIGAYIRTFIDGMQVLESIVNLTGSDVTAAGDPSVSTVLNIIELPGLQIVDTSAGGLAGLRDQIPDQVDLGALNDANGVILNDSKGFTAALHQIDRSQIVSALVNTANGRHLRQEVDVTVDIANFKQFQRTARSARKAGALSRTGRLR